MINEIGISVIRDAVLLLRKEEEFFSFDALKREEVIKNFLSANYPRTFVSYFQNLSEKGFFKDIRDFLNYIENKENFRTFSADLMINICKFLTQEFSFILDKLESKFFFLERSVRAHQLKEIIRGTSTLELNVIDSILENTYQEINDEINDFLKFYQDAPYILLQSAAEIEENMKFELRKYFLDKYPKSFPEFQINSGIIGGMRIFINGKIADHSWYMQVQKITQLSI